MFSHTFLHMISNKQPDSLIVWVPCGCMSTGYHFSHIIFRSTAKMPLLQLQTPHEPENIALAATHLPDQDDTILGCHEYNQVAAADVDLARPQPWHRGVREANVINIAD